MTDENTAEFDLIVFGLGPGGEDVAGELAQAGRRVLALDPRLVGGECPYFGCIPSKMIIRGGQVLAEGRRVDELAGSAVISPDYAPTARRIRDEATDNWDDKVAVDRLEGKGATFVRAAGRLTGRAADGRLRVEAGGRRYLTERVVIATGTAPAIPPIPGLVELRDATPGIDGPVWTNREIVKATAAPASMIVIGGGSIGVELAQAFARFGTRVSVLEGSDRLIAREEPEASAVVTQVLRREGVDVRTGAVVERVAADGSGVRVSLGDGSAIAADKLLVAAGRTPMLAGIGLSSIGLDDSARELPIDDQLRVLHGARPVPGLYAVGDIAGRGAFTHLAVWQAKSLAARLLGREPHDDGYRGLAWVTFTDPEVGRVGMSEQQARAAGLSVRAGGTTIAGSTRGWIHGPGNDGIVKLIEDTERGVLIGATVAGPYGGELLGLLTLAVHAEVPVSKLASMHYAYPTLHRAVLDAVTDLLSR
ncbi:MAG TPA: NAD(P)/FAD-dependent oxidoreductase [Jatrophihabitantaceae bacterium]|jgi:pyruvate/2-oxoglutarate dehydrogenase complex dihydrolipoamide dehydrogenase (E3) component|nr:NAD(P)/FAD-dependent oxidoreductase [Jatrophihabitantaceae bacterium]